MRLDVAAINATLGDEGWRAALIGCGVGEEFLRNRHGPCPVCGGKDRFRFDNKGSGAFFCSQCGSGYGFQLVMRLYGVDFSEARKRVMAAAGLAESSTERTTVRAAPVGEPELARPTGRVIKLLRENCAIEDCEPAMRYLESRALWPLPAGTRLRAHPSVEYWYEHKRVGRFPALVTAIRDVHDELVTAHITYLTHDGQKLPNYEPRKILSGMTGREGCAARIMHRETGMIGIAEGIETALSAAKLVGIPCWAALNSALLGKFEPPPEIDSLVIFADRDIGGLQAVAALTQRLQGRVRFEIRTPRAKDFNDVLRAA